MINRGCIRLVAAALMLAASALAADGADTTDYNALRLLLLAAQDMNTPHTLLRADIDIEVEIPDRTHKTEAIALFAPGKEARWYVQLREPGLQALVLGNERKVMERAGPKIQTIPIGATIDALGIAYEDLSRFVADDFQTWQITDESAETILVGMHPTAESAYVYRAYTFDKEKHLVLRVQFYAKTLNNLVKLRVDSDHVLIGKKWYPGSIQIQNYPENSTTRLRLRWSQNPRVQPELLVPASFAGTKPLQWSAPPSPGPTMSGGTPATPDRTEPRGTPASPAVRTSPGARTRPSATR